MTFPEVAGSVPASIASNVDLPAPFGPISPVSVPFRTENDTSRTARTPPNSRDRCAASSTTSPGGRRPSGAGPVGGVRSGTALAAAAVAAEPAGPALAASDGARITRLRSGSTPCGRNHKNSRMSSPIATHSSDGTRLGGRLLDVGM